MPKYRFKCENCSFVWEEWQSIEQETFLCSECDSGDIKKLPAAIFIAKRAPKASKKEIGEATKEHIEKNRDILKQMKKIADKREINI